jgi:hypothetical protein
MAGHEAMGTQGSGQHPAGLVPLGGGRYWDPMTGVIHGGGGNGNTFAV